jgi:hypothetical protein
MIRYIKFLKVFIFFVFFGFKGLLAGTFQLTPSSISNYSLTTGLIYYTDEGNIAVDTTGATCGTIGFCGTLVTSSTLYIGTFNIRYGQEWGDLTINIAHNTGSIDIYVKSDTQETLYTSLTVTSSKTISLSDLSQLVNGAPFSLTLVFNGNDVVTSITTAYSGNTLVCFPAPYEADKGEMKIVYEVDSASLATLEIYDNRGRHVKTIFASKYTGTDNMRSQNSTTWDGKDDAGRTVNTGVYTVVIRVVPLDTSTGAAKYTAKFKILVVR